MATGRVSLGRVVFAAAVLVLAGCRDDAPSPVSVAAPAPRATAAPRFADWPLPAPPGASRAELVRSAQGDLLLSWVERAADGDAFRFARYAAGRWSRPRTIASGADGFGNSADPPRLHGTADGALWAQWLRHGPGGGHVADVVLSRSADGGAHWRAPVVVNGVGTPGEHGFVALWSAADDRLGLAWLDGRATADGGMMMLRVAEFDASLARQGEATVDASACDCCQTDATLTSRGALVAYRDRHTGEVRDIATVRRAAAGWSAPRRVHADAWVMPACPVNGPAIASEGDAVLLAWYTAAGATPTIRLAASADAGDRFSAPRDVDRGDAVLGRVDLAMDADGGWLLWLREAPATQALWLLRVGRDGAPRGEAVPVADFPGRGRATGLPRAVLLDGRLHLTWTEVRGGRPVIKGRVEVR